MLRSRTCGELRKENVAQEVTLAGWVQRVRKMGGMTFVDLRDRYGVTQLVFNNEVNEELCERANKLGREFVIQIIYDITNIKNISADIPHIVFNAKSSEISKIINGIPTLPQNT